MEVDEGIKTEPRVVQCADWLAFRGRMSERPTTEFIYRGQRDASWLPESMYERMFRKFIAPQQSDRYRISDYDDGFRQFLERFKDNVHKLLQPPICLPTSEDEWMALARHHGVATPLLDWSHDPIVAGFFAFMDYFRNHHIHHPGYTPSSTAAEVPVAIWELRLSPELEQDSIRFRLINTIGCSRQVAQNGVFTQITDSDSLGLVKYLKLRNMAGTLVRYEIPGESYRDALCDFEDLGHSFATLFPDMYGAAEDALIGPYAKRHADIARQKRRGLSNASPLVSMHEIIKNRNS